MERFIGVFGIAALLGLAWLLSSARRAVPWRLVIAGIVLQLVLAWLLLSVSPIVRSLDAVAWVVNGIIASAAAGSARRSNSVSPRMIFHPTNECGRRFGARKMCS